MPLIKQRGFKGLNFSILCDVFLLTVLLLLTSFETRGQNVQTVPGVFSEDDIVLKPIVVSEPNNSSDQYTLELSRRFDLYGDYSKSPHDTIHRILRDEDTTAIRSDDDRVANIRWKKSADSTTHRKLSKRETAPDSSRLLPNTNSSSANSTKSLDLVNSNLTKFVIDSDLELQLKQSDDRLTIIRLNLTNNLLTEFQSDVLRPGLSRVTQLDLSHNRLRKFVLDEQSGLEMLNLSGNDISSFRVEGNRTRLRSLSVQNNNLSSESSEFDLAPIETLDTLDLSCNQLTQVNSRLLGSGRALKRLNLSRNQLRHIGKDAFYNLLNIETLVLSYNHIESIDAETFMVLPNLEYLDLSYNAIGAESIRSLQGIPDLVGLSIAYNPDLGDALQEFVASWSLKELDASGTGLCRIPAALAQSVRTLVLVDNWFEIISCGDLDSYPLLQYLDLSHSHIVEIEDDALGRLEILQTLFLDHNRLKRIPISLPTNLENLFLQNNEITDIQPQSLQQLTSLRTLDLSHNKLTYIPGLPLPKLLVLNLQSSGLRGLSQSVVKTSPKLRDLLLDGNPIKCTELMGIAEWASPCQNRDTITLRTYPAPSPTWIGQDKSSQQDIKKAFIQTHDYLVGFPDMWQECPSWTCERNETRRYRRTPLCATIKTNLLLQTNKLETQFNGTSASGNELPNAIVPNQSNEEIENSIEVKPAVAALVFPESRGKRLNKNSRNIGDNSSEGRRTEAKLLPNSTTAAGTDKRLGKIVDDNKNISSANARSNQRENKINDGMLADAQPSTTITPIFSTAIGVQLQDNMTGIVSTLTQLFGENTLRQELQELNGRSDKDTSTSTMPIRQISSSMTTTTSIPATTSQRNGFLSTEQPKLQQQISTNSHVNKLAQLPTASSSQPPTKLSLTTGWDDEQLSPTTTTIASINVALSDEMKTTATDNGQTKMMMLAIQRIGDVTPVEQQDIARESLNIASGRTYPGTITPTTTAMPTTAAPTKEALHLGRIVSKMSSSKVNKADKVVDHHHNPTPRQLLSSAINENGIIKRNQNSSSYYGHSRLLPPRGAEGVATSRPGPGHVNDGEKLIQRPAKVQSSNETNKGDQHHYQDISQQNQETTTTMSTTTTGDATTTSASIVSGKKKLSSHLLVDKMKDDKHLRFVGAKNLNLTVLTYNRKGHIHKTINKDISPQPRHSSSTVQPGEQQIFVELGVISASIESQSTTSASSVRSMGRISSSSIGSDQGHVKVNKKRIANESNNRQDNNRHQDRPSDETDPRPQLNALHALAVTTPNASSSHHAAVGLTPPAERWLDIRSATGHPGLLVVIGLTIGVFFTLGLIHIYRCRRPVPWRRASSSHLHDNFHSPHCCTNTGIESGAGGAASAGSNLHERSPGHFCSYSHNSTDDDAGYYIEPEQNRIRTAVRRDFLPMELLRSTTSAGCRDSKGRTKATTTGGGHHNPEGHMPSIW